MHRGPLSLESNTLKSYNLELQKVKVDAFKATITAAFDAHDLGEAAHFLGMAITRDRRARTIKLDQKTMAAQLVSKYGLDDAKPRGVPLSKSINN